MTPQDHSFFGLFLEHLTISYQIRSKESRYVTVFDKPQRTSFCKSSSIVQGGERKLCCLNAARLKAGESIKHCKMNLSGCTTISWYSARAVWGKSFRLKVTITSQLPVIAAATICLSSLSGSVILGMWCSKCVWTASVHELSGTLKTFW